MSPIVESNDNIILRSTSLSTRSTYRLHDRYIVHFSPSITRARRFASLFDTPRTQTLKEPTIHQRFAPLLDTRIARGFRVEVANAKLIPGGDGTGRGEVHGAAGA